MAEDNTKTIQVRVSIADSAALDKLVEDKKFISVSDAVRVAIRNLLTQTKLGRRP